METNEVIVLKTEPVIEYSKLEEISKEVTKRIDDLQLDKIEANEDTVKTLKEFRANLNKESALYEASRKTIKQLVLAPYEQFETSYKDLILNQFKSADTLLKSKIEDVEGKMKAAKENELKAYFEEVKEAFDIDFITYENVGMNVTLSASPKSLKEQILKFVQQIDSDLQIINTDEHKDDILIVYQRTLNLNQSIIQVKNDIKAKEELQAKREAILQESRRETNQTVKSTPIDPTLDEVLEVSFTVKASRKKLRELKAYLQINGIEEIEE